MNLAWIENRARKIHIVVLAKGVYDKFLVHAAIGVWTRAFHALPRALLEPPPSARISRRCLWVTLTGVCGSIVFLGERYGLLLLVAVAMMLLAVTLVRPIQFKH